MKNYYNSNEEFPEMDVRFAIRKGIERANEQSRNVKNKPNTVMKKFMYSLAIVVATFVILLGSSYLSPSLASSLAKLPIIGSVFSNSSIPSLQVAEKEGLTGTVGETQVVDGISVTFSEFLYDQNNISIGLLIESDKELGEHYFGAGMDMTINGKVPSYGSGSYGEEKISSTAFTAIQQINVTDDMPEQFELGLILTGKNGETWHFTTPVEKIKDIHQIAVNHTEKVGDIELRVKDISLSKTGVGLSYEGIEEGTDFMTSLGSLIEFKMFDDQGNEIPNYSGGVSGEAIKGQMIFNSIKQFDPIDDSVKELTITPYVDIPSFSEGVEVDSEGVEKTIEFERNSIKSVEFKPFTVKVR